MDDPSELFKALFETPLLVSEVQAPEIQLVVIIDALDELPKESQKPLLEVIASQLGWPWLKLGCGPLRPRTGPTSRNSRSRTGPTLMG